MDAALPVVFLAIMGISLVLYVILDGYDLGIGMLLPLASDREKDTMIAAIGPFWDANETWLVLGVGVLLIAFPSAHALVLTALYIPVTIMLFGLMEFLTYRRRRREKAIAQRSKRRAEDRRSSRARRGSEIAS